MLPPMLHPVRHVRANHSARPSIQQYHGSAGKQTFYFQFSLWLAVCSARDSINPLWGDFRKWNSLCLLTLAIDRDAAGTSASVHQSSWQLEVHPAECPGWHMRVQ